MRAGDRHYGGWRQCGIERETGEMRLQSLPRFIKGVLVYCIVMVCVFAGLRALDAVQGFCDSILQNTRPETLRQDLMCMFWIGIAAGAALMGTMMGVGIVASRYLGLFRGKKTMAGTKESGE
jgi:hypothetical protein